MAQLQKIPSSIKHKYEPVQNTRAVIAFPDNEPPAERFKIQSLAALAGNEYPFSATESLLDVLAAADWEEMVGNINNFADQSEFDCLMVKDGISSEGTH